MSRPVKELLRKDMSRRLAGVNSLALVAFTGVDANSARQVRSRLRQRQIRMFVVKNSIARQAFREMGLPAAADLLDGPTAVAYGSDSVVSIVRELLEMGKEVPALGVKGAVMEGEGYGPDQIEALSKYPTRDEAIGRVAGLAIAPGRRLAGCLVGPGGRVAGLIKAVEDRAKQAAPPPAEPPAAEPAAAEPPAVAPPPAEPPAGGTPPAEQPA